MTHLFRLVGLGFGLGLALAACDKARDNESAAAPVADAGGETCGAAEWQKLVGTGAGALDPAALPKGTRVLFPGMATTMDFRADRLNVSIGAGDKVDRVFCG